MKFFKPILAGAHRKDRILACIGAVLGIIVTVMVCASIPHEIADLPIIVAPLGASAVLVFAVPSSPLAQPWPVIGGNIISTLIGVAVFQAIPHLTIAAGVAVGAAILAMSMLRCLHPPGGAAALTAVIGSQNIHIAGYAFAFVPIGLNSITLVLAAMLFQRMSGHSYPHRVVTPITLPSTGVQLQDIDAALDDMHESFDIAREDLEALFSRAEHHAAQRQASA